MKNDEAVAIGNVHGLETIPHIDISLLAKIAEICPFPLVLHGGSGIPFDVIHKAKQHNLIKINYGADLRKAFGSTFGQTYVRNHQACNLIDLSLNSIKNVAATTRNLVEAINQ